VEVDSSKYSDRAQAWYDGGRSMLNCDLLQTIDANSIDRFTIEWFIDCQIDSYELIETCLTFSRNGEKVRTKPMVQSNPYFNKTNGVTIISMR
jgi:hypothetical protein